MNKNVSFRDKRFEKNNLLKSFYFRSQSVFCDLFVPEGCRIRNKKTAATKRSDDDGENGVAGEIPLKVTNALRRSPDPESSNSSGESIFKITFCAFKLIITCKITYSGGQMPLCCPQTSQKMTRV